MRRGGAEVGAAVTAGRQHHGLAAEEVQRALVHVQREHAAADALVVEDQVDREVFDEERGVVRQRLLVQRVQDRVAGAVGRGAGALRGALAVMRGHAAERALVDLAFLGARERHAVVLQLDDRGDRLAAHVLDRVLVAEPVGALDRVVEMEAPVVLAHVAQRGGDAALRRHGMRTGREHLGDAGGLEAFLGQAERGAQAGAAGADHDHVVLVLLDLVAFHERSSWRLRGQRNAQDRQHARERAEHREELDRHHQGHFLPAGVHVVFDHHLQAEHGMPEHGDHEGDQQHRVPGLRHGRTRSGVVGMQQRQHGDHKPQAQQHQRDGGDPLGPPVAHAGLRRAEAARRLIGCGDLHDAPSRSCRTSVHQHIGPDQHRQHEAADRSTASWSARTGEWRSPRRRPAPDDGCRCTGDRDRPRSSRTAAPCRPGCRTMLRKWPKLSSPAARCSRPHDDQRLPAASAMPVARCRMEVIICTCHL